MQTQLQSQPSLPLVEQEHERSRSPSPLSANDQEQIELSSPFVEQTQPRSRSVSPVIQHEQARSRSPSPIVDRGAYRSRSPSPIMEQNDQKSPAQSPTSARGQTKNHQETESPPLPIEQKTERSPSLTHQAQQGDLFAADSSENQSSFTNNNSSPSEASFDHDAKILSTSQLGSPSKTNALASPKLEESQNSQWLSNPDDEAVPHLQANVSSSPIQEPEGLNHSRSSTPSSSNTRNKLTEKEELLSHESLKESLPEDHSSQASKSSVHETISSAMPEKHNPIASIPSKALEHQDHHEESPIKAPTTRQANITRSKSQSAVARPNTLPFSPNNDDLDGLYTSNDYDDEDEISYDSEYHHNSAPSTVSIEYRRCSLFDDSNTQQQHVPPDPNDISKRLSIVEQSRTEGILITFMVLGINSFRSILSSPFSYHFLGKSISFIPIIPTTNSLLFSSIYRW